MDLSWDQILKSLVFWGPGAVIAGMIIFALFRLANTFGTQFIAAQQAQAQALGAQAQALTNMTSSLQDYIVRDNAEHREMLVLLKYIARKNQDFEDLEREHYKRISTCMKCEEADEPASDAA